VFGDRQVCQKKCGVTNVFSVNKESRNGHAFHPIIRKGGVHEKTTSTKLIASKWRKK
jgi:hypothetical protein